MFCPFIARSSTHVTQSIDLNFWTLPFPPAHLTFAISTHSPLMADTPFDLVVSISGAQAPPLSTSSAPPGLPGYAAYCLDVMVGLSQKERHALTSKWDGIAGRAQSREDASAPRQTSFARSKFKGCRIKEWGLGQWQER